MKMIVSDLDGTILTTDKKITDFTRETIYKLREIGIEFVIATGRSMMGCVDILDSIDSDIYIVCNNGGSIYDKDRNLLFYETIDQNLSQEIIYDFRRLNLHYRAFSRNNYFVPDYFNVLSERIENSPIILNNVSDYPDLEKIIILNDNESLLEDNKNFLLNKYGDKLNIIFSSHNCLDIVPKTVTKKTGIQKIGDILNISLKEMISFGDSENDLSMLTHTGLAVTMKDSYAASVLQNHQSTTETNDNNGVAIFIQNYFNF